MNFKMTGNEFARSMRAAADLFGAVRHVGGQVTRQWVVNGQLAVEVTVGQNTYLGRVYPDDARYAWDPYKVRWLPIVRKYGPQGPVWYRDCWEMTGRGNDLLEQVVTSYTSEADVA